MDYQLGPGPLQVDQNTTDEKIKGDIGIVENGDIATHAILKDYYVIWKGNLYKAKTDISSGTTLSAEFNGNLDPKSNGLGGEVAALNSNMQTKDTLFITGSSSGTTQTFNIANKGYSNPIFLLSIGYDTKHLVGIVFINAMNEGNIAFQKLIGTSSFDVTEITYANGLITVTFSSQPYRIARLLLLGK